MASQQLQTRIQDEAFRSARIDQPHCAAACKDSQPGQLRSITFAVHSCMPRVQAQVHWGYSLGPQKSYQH